MEHYKSDEFWCIYAHINKINGKIYIGQSKDTKNRWKKQGTGYGKNCRYFHYAIEKYGWNNFIHIILFKDLTKEMANIIEIELIKKYKTTDSQYGYNISMGGSGVTLKGEYNPVSIQVHQYGLDGKYIKSWPNATIVHDELNIDNYEIGLAAKQPGERHAGKYLWSYEKYDRIEPKKDFRGLYLKVYQIDFDGNLINIYDNLHSIPELNTTGINCVRNCCKQEALSYKGYIWFYENDYLEDIVKQRLYKVNHRNEEFRKKIRMYTLDGNYIRSFSYSGEASKYTGLNSPAISIACRGGNNGRNHRSGDYLWYFEDDIKDIHIDPWKCTMSKPVYQYDLDGNFIKKYDSKVAAEKEYGTGIGSKIRKGNHISYNYIWIYEQDIDKLQEILNLQKLNN